MAQRVLQFLLDDIADHAFGFGPQHVQRVGLVRLVGRRAQGQQADLGAVAMGDHQLMTGADDRRQPLGGNLHVGALGARSQGFAPFQQGVTAQGCNNQHGQPPRVATSTALMVCMRFSAWSKTIEAGLSNTSSVTSMAAMPNFCSISLPITVSVLWNAGRQCMKRTRGLPVLAISCALT